ncbi:hypothetical protein PF003_g36301 [Phytophthora fragariae]|nr:hypothetical protein PF003_g36301 [Phytophthora fragariae]
MKTQWALKVSAKSCKDCDKPFQVHSSRVNCHACGHVHICFSCLESAGHPAPASPPIGCKRGPYVGHTADHSLELGTVPTASDALDKLHAATKLDADVQGVAQELDASLDDQEQRADQKVNALYVGELCR